MDHPDTRARSHDFRGNQPRCHGRTVHRRLPENPDGRRCRADTESDRDCRRTDGRVRTRPVHHRERQVLLVLRSPLHNNCTPGQGNLHQQEPLRPVPGIGNRADGLVAPENRGNQKRFGRRARPLATICLDDATRRSRRPETRPADGRPGPGNLRRTAVALPWRSPGTGHRVAGLPRPLLPSPPGLRSTPDRPRRSGNRRRWWPVNLRVPERQRTARRLEPGRPPDDLGRQPENRRGLHLDGNRPGNPRRSLPPLPVRAVPASGIHPRRKQPPAGRLRGRAYRTVAVRRDCHLLPDMVSDQPATRSRHSRRRRISGRHRFVVGAPGSLLLRFHLVRSRMHDRRGHAGRLCQISGRQRIRQRRLDSPIAFASRLGRPTRLGDGHGVGRAGQRIRFATHPTADRR